MTCRQQIEKSIHRLGYIELHDNDLPFDLNLSQNFENKTLLWKYWMLLLPFIAVSIYLTTHIILNSNIIQQHQAGLLNDHAITKLTNEDLLLHY